MPGDVQPARPPRRAARVSAGMDATFRGLYEDQVLYTKLALHLARGRRSPTDRRCTASTPTRRAQQSIAAGTWQPHRAQRARAAHFMAVDGAPTSTSVAGARLVVARRSCGTTSTTTAGWAEPPATASGGRGCDRRVPAPVPPPGAPRGLAHAGRAQPIGARGVERAVPRRRRGGDDGARSSSPSPPTAAVQPWVDERAGRRVPDPGLQRRAGRAGAAPPAAAFDHVVVPLGAAEPRCGPSDVGRRGASARAARWAAPRLIGATAQSWPSGAAGASGPLTSRRSATPHDRGRPWRPGSRRAARRSVALDRHDPAVPVISALTIERRRG